MTALSYKAAFERIPGDSAKGMVLIADHAMRALPETYGRLGLPEREFDRHIAYDIGVADVTRQLAHLTGVPAVLCGFSRLLIDPNRSENDPTLIRQLYDGTIIGGNYPLGEEERNRRLELYYRPYHAAVSALIEETATASGAAPLIVSVHSFTPVMQDRHRPWHVGLLWDRDDRATRFLLDTLSRDPTLTVGDNEPYDGALPGDTMHRHGTMNGYAHTLIEIRQDLIADRVGANSWAERLAPMLDALNTRPDMHETKHYGSRTDAPARE